MEDLPRWGGLGCVEEGHQPRRVALGGTSTKWGGPHILYGRRLVACLRGLVASAGPRRDRSRCPSRPDPETPF